MKSTKTLLVAGATLALTAMAAPQIKQLLKIVGVGAAVQKFGPDINKAINKLASHTDTKLETTKVVPIISAGLASRQSIGAAQVMGPAAQVAKVKAVAQLEQDIFGREIKIRAMIPIDSKDAIKNIKKVEGVAVTGIVDLKL